LSPRPYSMAHRDLAAEQTRARIMRAARELLSDPAGISAFTIEAVAKQARVARMTVYYQFQSKRGLLEALFDDVARGGEMARLKDAFREPDPRKALDEFIARFVFFWSSDRLIIRRLRSLGALDPEIDEGLRARDDRRRHGLQVIFGRLFQGQSTVPSEQGEEFVDILQMLTSFETYDQLAGNERSAAEVASRVQKLAWRLLGWSSEGRNGGLYG